MILQKSMSENKINVLNCMISNLQLFFLSMTRFVQGGMSEQTQANKKKKGASKKKKKRPVQVLDLNDSENVDSDAKDNSISSSATESSACPIDTKSVKPRKKKKKGKKPATSLIEQPPSVEPVSSPEDEDHLPKEEKEETQPPPIQSSETSVNEGDKAAASENGVDKSRININVPNKRPTAADLINSSEESSDDAETSVTELARGSETVPAPKAVRRATAVDFMEESTAKESEKEEIVVPVIPKEEPEETAPQIKITGVVPKEEPDQTPPPEAASSQEEQDFGGGLEFLGYPNFDAYSNVLLPAGINYFNNVNSF